MHIILENALLNLGIKVDLNVISSKVKNLLLGKYRIHIIEPGTVYLYLQNTAPPVNCYNRVKFKTFNNELTTILSNVQEDDFNSTTVNYDGIEIELYYKSKPTTGPRCGKEYDKCPYYYAKITYPNCCKGFKCIEHPDGWYADCHAPTPPPPPTPKPPRCIPNNSIKESSNHSYTVPYIPDVTPTFFNSNLKGVNITGFDNGGSVTDANSKSPFLTDAILVQKHYDIITIEPSFNNYIIDNSIQIARLPVMPFYIFKRNPYPFYEGSSALSPIFDGIYSQDCSCSEKHWTANEPWCKGGMHCNGDYRNWKQGCPNYLWAIKQLIKQKIFCIIDIHSDNYNLCSLSTQKGKNLPMSPEEFIAMWQHIAHYIFTNLHPNEHKYIIFELCNEPVGTGSLCLNISGCLDKHPIKCQQQYDLSYQIPTIAAIKSLEKKHSPNVDHIIMVTTYNNWSGVHFWAPGDNYDGTLDQLATDLSSNGYRDSNKSKVIIAGHQYCDSDYSGEGADCSKGFSDKAEKWVTGIEKILTPHKLLWFQTEGNIMAERGSVLNHSDEYKHYLNSLFTSSSNIGYTLWFMNSTGIDPQYPSPGLGNMNFPSNKDNYNKIYNISGTHMYNGFPLPKYHFNNLLK
jgi:hypothetical protein